MKGGAGAPRDRVAGRAPRPGPAAKAGVIDFLAGRRPAAPGPGVAAWAAALAALIAVTTGLALPSLLGLRGWAGRPAQPRWRRTLPPSGP